MRRLSLFLIIGFSLMILVSAQELSSQVRDTDWTWDNSLNFQEKEGSYGKYYIRDSILGLWDADKVSEIELKSNTFSCDSNCEAIKEIVLYKDTRLIEDIRFYEITNEGLILTEINSYALFVLRGEDWVPYNYEVVEAGTYTIKLIGDKSKNQLIDWQIKTNGIWLEDWALWGDPLERFEWFLGPSNNGRGTLDMAWTAQTFTVGTQGSNRQQSVTNVSFFSPSLVTPKITIRITDVNGSQHPINIDDPYAIGQSVVAILGAWTNVSMDPLKLLDPSTEYAIIMNVSDATVDWRQRETTANYSGGTLVTSEDGGANWETVSRDQLFEIWSGEGSGGFVVLNAPGIDFSTASNPTLFNGTAELNGGATIVNMSLWTNETGDWEVRNTTVTTGVMNTSTWLRSFDGSIDWNIEACDSDGDCGFNSLNRTLVFDLNAPVTSIIAPVGILTTNVVGNPENLNWTVFDSNLDACWFNYNGTNITTICGDNHTTFILESNNLNLTFYANDTAGNLNSSFTTWEYEFLEGNSTFNASTFETSRESFITNITTLADIINVNPILNYNGTRTLGTAICSGTTCTLSATIDIVLVITGESEVKDWFWEVNGFTANSSFEFNSTVQTQTVNRIHLEECGGGFTDDTLEFTAFQESTLAAVDPFEFQGNFELWLGTGEIRRQSNFSKASVSSLSLCIDPTDRGVQTDATIEYDEAVGTNFTRRNYYFGNDTLNSTVQDIGLGLLLATSSTSFILAVQDTDILPLPDVLIFTERFYPGIDTFEIVQVASTDENGQSVGFFKTETVDYRFILKIAGITVLTTEVQKIVGTSIPFTLTFTVGIDQGSAWEPFEEVGNLTFTNDFNKTSQDYFFTYEDTSGDFDLAALEIYRVNASGNDPLICNETISQSTASLSCGLAGNSTGQYIAKGRIFRDGVNLLVFQEQFNIENFSEIAGDLGLFLGWFLILIAAFAFRFNEIAGIFMVNITVLFVNTIGLIAFGPVFISALMGISIIIGVILER